MLQGMCRLGMKHRLYLCLYMSNAKQRYKHAANIKISYMNFFARMKFPFDGSFIKKKKHALISSNCRSV